jgi:hypothetical protein
MFQSVVLREDVCSRSVIVKTILLALVVLSSRVDPQTWAATIDDVRFLNRIETYETIVDTILVTQEGKRIPIDKGTRVNVAGFTETDAFVVSRIDRPNGFIRHADLVPVARSRTMEPPLIKEETLP